MEKVDILIIGAGAVGLAAAERLSRRGGEIVVVEKHDGFGREASSRNSEVVHAGFYYPEDSLKAKLCVEGRPKLYSFCETHNIPFRKTGKIVVANNLEEEQKIHHLFEQGGKNGVEGLRFLSRSELKAMEPGVKAKSALFSSETGIFDTHQLMNRLEGLAMHNGVLIAYNCLVTGIKKDGDEFTVEVRDADGENTEICSSVVVNAAGLCSDAIAEAAGIDPDKAGYRIYPCKGEYFSVSGRHKNRLSHLVYPAPTTISLGIHVVIGLDGGLRLGPNAFYVDSLDYDVDVSHGAEFFRGASEYLTFIEPGDLSPDMSGIRPKLQKISDSFRDFIIEEEGARGLSGLVNCIGIESPGLTSCLAVAGMIDSLIA